MLPIGIPIAISAIGQSCNQLTEKFAMHHTVAWRLSIADATETDVTPVTDGIMSIQNGHFVPSKNLQLLYAYFGAAGANRARFITPTFRQITSPWIRPVGLAIVPGVQPLLTDYRQNPLTLNMLEEIQLMGTQTTGGAAVVVAIAGLASIPVGPAPAGNIFTMRGTATATLVAGAWTQGAVTWQDTLPAGMYAVVGMQYIGTTALAARLIFNDQIERPGCVATGLVTSRPHPMFQLGGLGQWGRFSNNVMPNVEFLANAADTAQEVYLDLIRVG